MSFTDFFKPPSASFQHAIVHLHLVRRNAGRVHYTSVAAPLSPLLNKIYYSPEKCPYLKQYFSAVPLLYFACLKVAISLEKSSSSANEASLHFSQTGTYTHSMQKTPCFSSSPYWATSSERSQQPTIVSSIGSGRSTPLITGVTKTIEKNGWTEVVSEDSLETRQGNGMDGGKAEKEQVRERKKVREVFWRKGR